MAETKTSSSSWKKQLSQILAQVAQTKQSNKLDQQPAPARVALVGVGNELNGDDAAGIWVARKLLADRTLPPHFLAIDGGSLPENASGPLRRFQPDLVIFVDAADLDEPAGVIKWLDGAKISGMSASSHTLPLPVLGKFLESELNCRVEYLGIQPLQINYLQEMSDCVNESVYQVVNEFKDQFLGVE